MIWPILARYTITLAMGLDWAHLPSFGRVLSALVLALVVLRDLLFDGLRRDGLCRPESHSPDAPDAEREE